ncbi:MAG: flagellar hook-associated protein FlgK [Paracoccus sp. (in: a-proteobacteria)]
MSITNALNNAVSGLSAVARGTEVVSSNLANVQTPGYARRELDLSPRTYTGNGGGVYVDGVNRIISNAILSDYRLANAELASSSVTYGFYKSLEAAIGLPQDSGSLSALLTGLETSLATAASRPDSEVRLNAVLDSANRLVEKIGAISTSIQGSRTDADRQIGSQVKSLDTGLKNIARFNRQIIIEHANGRDVSSLADARQAVIDQISAIVPVRELTRENGRIALFTAGGAVLLDGNRPVEINFQPSGRLTADMDGSSAHLGRLIIDGEAVDAQEKPFSGGSLSELFKLRDEYGVAAQVSVDAIARELHDRFADPAIDPTINAGQSGLFTDRNGSFDPADERGLAARLQVNTIVDNAQGGSLWRIRDGIYASVQGNVGDAKIINNLARGMEEFRSYSSASISGASGNLTTLVAMTLSQVASDRLNAESQEAQDTALHMSLQNALLSGAVDSDKEIEILLQLERTYAANAKVIQTIDKMFDNILRI